MTKRFKNALMIQQGACNPSGVALALHEACKEVLAENGDQRSDPAVRLITHQLAFLMNVNEIDDSLTAYGRLTDECKAKEQGL